MAQTFIAIGMSGNQAMENLNGNFTELYDALSFPVRLPGLSGNQTWLPAANTFVQDIDVMTASGTPTLSIGTTPNGTDILANGPVGSFLHVVAQAYFAGAATIYFTIAGGSINVRITTQPNYF